MWLTGGGLVLCLAMIIGLLGLVLYQGGITFWPRPVTWFATADGRVAMGEVMRTEAYRPAPGTFDSLPAAGAEAAQRMLDASGGESRRMLVRTGNFELTGEHFAWVDEAALLPEGVKNPSWALVCERLSWGRFYGEPAALLIDGKAAETEPGAIWNRYRELHPEVRDRWRRIRKLEKHDLGRINRRLEDLRLAVRQAELDHGPDSPEAAERIREVETYDLEADRRIALIHEEMDQLTAANDRYAVRMRTGDGRLTDLPLASIVRAYPANRIGAGDKLGVYLSRWWEYLSDEPREANSEGGVFPAIFGTVVMTLLMSLLVVPFGVLAALYLREYAKAGALVSTVRISINNLAGVPSIVFGVFGLGFFCYMVGGTIDEVFHAARLPNPTYGTGGVLWASLTLALLTLPVVIVATEEALSAVPNSMREGSYACGASKWQTIRRIVLPRAMPGIMTGAILAMARGAGEVAPLMLVGAVKLAPELPVDGIFPYIHPERSFMHLGFHIFDLGFQSQNSEAAKPMVFTTTLLLIAIVTFLNIAAIRLRTRLRRKFVASHF